MKMKQLLLTAIAVLALFTSCQREYDFSNPLVGSWKLVKVDNSNDCSATIQKGKITFYDDQKVQFGDELYHLHHIHYNVFLRFKMKKNDKTWVEYPYILIGEKMHLTYTNAKGCKFIGIYYKMN